jgi:hypothetical protein
MRTTLNIEDELSAKAAELTGVPLWTLDNRLNEVATTLGIFSFKPFLHDI